MPKKTKLNLNNINVESFVTKKDENDLKGGYTTRPWTYYPRVCGGTEYGTNCSDSPYCF